MHVRLWAVTLIACGISALSADAAEFWSDLTTVYTIYPQPRWSDVHRVDIHESDE